MFNILTYLYNHHKLYKEFQATCQNSLSCTVVIAHDPQGSIADNTDYIYCDKFPAAPIADHKLYSFPACWYHFKLFRLEPFI